MIYRPLLNVSALLNSKLDLQEITMQSFNLITLVENLTKKTQTLLDYYPTT